jgi:hypothetical protein
MTSNPPIARLLANLLLVLAAVTCSTGCATSTGALWYKMFGPVAVPAKFTLAKVPTLVVVENFRNPALSELDAYSVARDVVEDLKKHDTAPMIEIERLDAVREKDPAGFRKMTIPALGKATDATQVIYVDLIQSDVEAEASHGVIRGRAEARVRVVETSTGNTIWPVDSQAGYAVGAEVPYTRSDDPGAATEVHNSLLDSLSEQIGRLFHEWKPETNKESDEG